VSKPSPRTAADAVQRRPGATAACGSGSTGNRAGCRRPSTSTPVRVQNPVVAEKRQKKVSAAWHWNRIVDLGIATRPASAPRPAVRAGTRSAPRSCRPPSEYIAWSPCSPSGIAAESSRPVPLAEVAVEVDGGTTGVPGMLRGENGGGVKKQRRKTHSGDHEVIPLSCRKPRAVRPTL